MFTTIQFARYNFNIYFLYQRKTMFLSFYERKISSTLQQRVWVRERDENVPIRPQKFVLEFEVIKTFYFFIGEKTLSQKLRKC